MPLEIGKYVLEPVPRRGALKNRRDAVGGWRFQQATGAEGPTLLCSHRNLRSSLNSEKIRPLAIAWKKHFKDKTIQNRVGVY